MRAEIIDAWVGECRKRLPFQNPLGFFVHNNPVMPYEEEPFLDAMRRIATLYRGRPFRTEAYYREAYAQGRISQPALSQAMSEQSLGTTIEEFLATHEAPDTFAKGSLVAERHLQDLLVPLVATYLDQGIAGWHPPWSDSFWHYFVATVRHEPTWADSSTPKIRQTLLRFADVPPEEIIYALAHEARPEAPLEYVLETAFLLKGWSGMVLRLQDDPSLLPNKKVRISMIDWLASLLVARAAVHGIWETFAVCDTARLLTWQTAFELEWQWGLVRRLGQRTPAEPMAATVQALVCMDDREESFRRALERGRAPVETYGTVGFFGIDMRYQGLGAAQPTNQCPPVVTPSRTIPERGDASASKQVIATWLARGALMHYYATRTLILGLALSLIVGIIHFAMLALRVWSPRVAAMLNAWSSKRFVRPAFTSIEYDGPSGYTHQEQTLIVDGILRNAGLTNNFAPWVCVMAHTATTTNNPFQQAYGCGACSGNSGAPNARVFALMANDPEIRAQLAARGIEIPRTTTFVPYLHDTTADICKLLEPERYKPLLGTAYATLRATLDEACARNAQERCARFVHAPTSPSGTAALAHVQSRSLNLAQPRPEYGHSRVAACIVGRRALTSSLHLDRRAFLVSYDPTQDRDGRVLIAAVLGTVPVAVNISYDYFFSSVDNDSFGAGSKLPLNVCSLLGVITGSKGDLRIGLASQAVERHEPMRIPIYLEAPEPYIEALLTTSARLRQLVEHEWIYLAQIHPETGQVRYRKRGAYVSPYEAWPQMPAAEGPANDALFQPAHDMLGDVT